MLSPGASKSRKLAEFEKPDTKSDLFVDPTLTAVDTHPGDVIPFLSLLLPEATAVAMSKEATQGTLQELVEDHTSFSFFQAVRLLQRLRADREPVGGVSDPKDEVVRCSANPSLAFPAGEIQDLEDRPDRPWQMMVKFMGLGGNLGGGPHD